MLNNRIKFVANVILRGGLLVILLAILALLTTQLGSQNLALQDSEAATKVATGKIVARNEDPPAKPVTPVVKPNTTPIQSSTKFNSGTTKPQTTDIGGKPQTQTGSNSSDTKPQTTTQTTGSDSGTKPVETYVPDSKPANDVKPVENQNGSENTADTKPVELNTSTNTGKPLSTNVSSCIVLGGRLQSGQRCCGGLVFNVFTAQCDTRSSENTSVVNQESSGSNGSNCALPNETITAQKPTCCDGGFLNGILCMPNGSDPASPTNKLKGSACSVAEQCSTGFCCDIGRCSGVNNDCNFDDLTPPVEGQGVRPKGGLCTRQDDNITCASTICCVNPDAQGRPINRCSGDGGDCNFLDSTVPVVSRCLALNTCKTPGEQATYTDANNTEVECTCTAGQSFNSIGCTDQNISQWVCNGTVPTDNILPYATTPAENSGSQSASTSTNTAISSTTQYYQGVPYAFGVNDCSSSIEYYIHQVNPNLTLPDGTAAQLNYFTRNRGEYVSTFSPDNLINGTAHINQENAPVGTLVYFDLPLAHNGYNQPAHVALISGYNSRGEPLMTEYVPGSEGLIVNRPLNGNGGTMCALYGDSSCTSYNTTSITTPGLRDDVTEVTLVLPQAYTPGV